MRQELLGDLAHPTGAYLYSQAVAMPDIPNTDFLLSRLITSLRASASERSNLPAQNERLLRRKNGGLQ